MQPPICEVCDERFDPASGGRLVSFVETDAGREFAGRAVPGHAPDDGWFCQRHVADAAALATTHTRRAAVGELRGLQTGQRPTGSSSPTDRRRDEFRRRVERRAATTVEHELGRSVGRDVVADRFRAAADRAVERLGLDSVEPVERHARSSAASPEPRDAIGTTTTTDESRWSTDEHEVRWRDEDTRWDSWAGIAGGGDRMQGTIHLAIDDTWLYASYGSDGVVRAISESGERTPVCSDIIDDLVDGLRSPS